LIPKHHISIKCQKISNILNLDYTKVIRPGVNSHLGNMELKIEEIDDIEATRQRLDLIGD